MNAPAPVPMLFEPTIEIIPVTAIRPSQTHIQALRRQHFNAEKLLELAESIRGNGLLQPILVRPLARPAGAVQYEIVAGERRWLAAGRAGFAQIPAAVSELDDAQVLEAQLVENLQREELQALEEAEGYRELMDLKHIAADDVAAMIGKSRSYVYARLKLLDLCAGARQALQEGAIDASKAQLIARIKGDELQARALKLVTEQGQYYSYRRLVEKLRDDFMIPLAGAPFAIDDDTIAPVKGAPLVACIECPHFSGNDPELRAQIGDADVCTDRACFDTKTRLFWGIKRRAAEAAGRTVLSDSKPAPRIPGRYDNGIKAGYLDLDAEAAIGFPEPEPEQAKNEPDEAFEARLVAWEAREQAWRAPTYRKLLGDAPAEAVLIEANGGRLVELVPVKAVAKALKAAGVEDWLLRDRENNAETTAEDPAKAAAERAREEERLKVEAEYRRRLFAAIFAKWKGQLKRPDFQRIAEAMELDKSWTDGVEILQAAHGGEYDLAKLREPELIRLIALQPLAEEAEELYDKPGAMLETAQRLKIDPKKIRAEVIKDLKPVSAPAAEKPAKKGGKK